MQLAEADGEETMAEEDKLKVVELVVSLLTLVESETDDDTLEEGRDSGEEVEDVVIEPPGAEELEATGSTTDEEINGVEELMKFSECDLECIGGLWDLTGLGGFDVCLGSDGPLEDFSGVEDEP